MLSSSILVCSSDAEVIATCGILPGISVPLNEANANAELIVRAVNEHAALAAVAEAAENCNKSWNVGTVSHLKDCLFKLASVHSGKAQGARL